MLSRGHAVMFDNKTCVLVKQDTYFGWSKTLRRCAWSHLRAERHRTVALNDIRGARKHCVRVLGVAWALENIPQFAGALEVTWVSKALRRWTPIYFGCSETLRRCSRSHCVAWEHLRRHFKKVVSASNSLCITPLCSASL